MDHQVPVGQQQYFQGQFPHPMFPPWPVHPPPGALPVFQPYPVQGMPYYQSYPGNAPFYHPPYPPPEDPCFNVGHSTGQKRQLVDSTNSNTESEAWQMDATKTRAQGDLELEKEASESWGPRKKAVRSGKKQSGMVVIRNINYIASKGHDSSGSESQSASESENDEETGDFQASDPDIMPKSSMSSKRKGSHSKSVDEANLFRKEETNDGKETDGGHWQAFQSFLLRDTDERNRAADEGMLASEKNVQIKRRQTTAGDDHLAVGGRDLVEFQDGRTIEFVKASGNVTKMLRQSNGEDSISRGEGRYGDGRGFTNDQMDVEFAEVNGRKVAYRRKGNDDFMIVGQESQSHFTGSSDPLAINGFIHTTNDRSSSQEVTDESFIVPFRSMSLDQVGNSQNCYWRGNLVKYEPNDLTLMPERETEKMNFGYDPALDYEMQGHVEDAASLDNRNRESVADVRQGSKKSEKDRKSKVAPDSLDKKKTVGPIRKGKPSKTSPLEDARARAEKLRSFKADLQKMKKEKEEEDRKRLEALKIERQKRIAARASSTASQSSSSQQSRKQLPTKLMLSSVRGSKFSDSEPGSSSPLQRSKIRAASLGSSESQKASKMSKSSDGGQLPGSRLTRSVSSLPDPRKEKTDVTPDPKPSMAQIRRLSKPKTTSSPYSAPVKTRGAELVSKPKVYNEPESKKISAIINLDRSKAATLPELKIRTSKGSLDIGQNKSAPKEQKMSAYESSVSSGRTALHRDGDKHTHQSDVDDNPVIDKTVVMLECEKPSFPIVHSSEENMGGQKEHYENHDRIERIEMISDYAGMRAPPSPVDGVVIEPVRSQVQEQPRFQEVTACYAEREQQSSSITCTAEKPSQAPFARLSSLEDPCCEKSEYGKAPSMALETVTMGVETVKAQASDLETLKLAKIPEVLGKPQVKESSKGFRRLLKFGKKSHSSVGGEHRIESDNAIGNGSEVDGKATNAASSSEVHTLKNLISQDENPPEATSQKYTASHHFSLLSPFRNKTSEKKVTT